MLVDVVVNVMMANLSQTLMMILNVSPLAHSREFPSYPATEIVSSMAPSLTLI